MLSFPVHEQHFKYTLYYHGKRSNDQIWDSTKKMYLDLKLWKLRWCPPGLRAEIQSEDICFQRAPIPCVSPVVQLLMSWNQGLRSFHWIYFSCAGALPFLSPGPSAFYFLSPGLVCPFQVAPSCSTQTYVQPAISLAKHRKRRKATRSLCNCQSEYVHLHISFSMFWPHPRHAGS